MTVQEYKDEILLRLGSPVVKVEVADYIEKIVKSSMRELKKYITDMKIITVPYQNSIDMSSYNINSVIYVMRSESMSRVPDFNDVIYLSINKYPPESLSTSDYRRYMLLNQIKNTLSTDLDFTWDKPTLYVSANYPKPDHIAIACIPEYNNPEDITDPYWEDLLLRLSLANTKVMLGRVRGKYELTSSNYKLDGAQLLSEGTAELNEIHSFLDTNSDIVMPID